MNFQQPVVEDDEDGTRTIRDCEFDIADVVRLVSGGPPMTVTNWKGVMVHCEQLRDGPIGSDVYR